ncbi:MAG: hypothetical protein ACK5UC_17710 [Planctomycetaceae bacterium]
MGGRTVALFGAGTIRPAKQTPWRPRAAGWWQIAACGFDRDAAAARVA